MRPLRNEQNRRRYFKFKNQRLKNYESLMLWHVRRFMRAQQDRILERLPEDRKGLTDTIFNKEKEKELMAQEMLPPVKEVVKEEGKEVTERLGGEYEVSPNAERFIQERSNNLAGQITDTTFSRLKNSVEEGYRQGENYRQIADRVRDKYDQISQGRAEVIARTEAHTAAQHGNFDGYGQTGVKTKIWTAVMDSATRPSHAFLDGEEVMYNQKFSNGLMYPGDPNGPAREVVNCRCTI